MSGTGTVRVGSEANLEILSGGVKEFRNGWHFDHRGTGVIRAPYFCDSNVIFENSGDLELAYSSGEIFACPLINRPSGVVRKTGAGSSQVHRLESQGTVEVESGTLVPDRETNIRGRTVIHPDAVLRFGTFGPLTLHETAAVFGTGTLAFGNASSTVNSARFEPGLSPGILKVDGAFHCDPGMTLHIEVGGKEPGTEYDQLAVANGATICGTLNVTGTEGFDPYDEQPT
jgi:hypothetical protein